MPVSQNIKSAMSAAGAAPVFGCRAWVNFNGTGVVAIRRSGNVSSITDNGAGDYTINFQTQMSDANYCTIGACRRGTVGADTNADFSFPVNGIYGVTAVQVRTQAYNDRAPLDADFVNVAVFG